MIIEPFNSKGDLIITCNVGQNFSLLSGLPGRKKWVERQLVVASIGANIAYLMEHWPTADWRPGASTVRDRYLELKMQEENTRQEKKENLLDAACNYDFRTNPFNHQLQAFLLSRDLPAFALFHEQGCGKTKVIIDNAAYLFEKGLIDHLVVVTKNGVHVNWIINEIPKHLPLRIPHTRTFYRAGKANQKILEPESKRKGKLHICSFNIEGFTSPAAKDLLERWLRTGRTMLVIDESQKIKNPTAQRTKFMLKMAPLASYRRIMTGTPVTRGIENLYSQFTFLDPDILGHKSFYTFRNQFCVMGGFQLREIVSYRHVEDLIKIIDGHSHRVLKKDCLDLPPKIYKRLPFALSPKQAEIYHAYRKDAIEELTALLGEEKALERAQDLAFTKALRLQQIACGFYPGPEQERIPGPNPRMIIALEQMEDCPTKQIVWARFKPDMEDLVKAWGAPRAVGYFGGINERDRLANMQRFKNSDKTQYMVMSQAAGAEGHDLWMAESALFHSNVSSLDQRLQGEDRCHRIGTRNPVTYIDMEMEMVHRHSIDKKIIRTLRKHKQLADIITQDPIRVFMDDAEEEDDYVMDLPEQAKGDAMLDDKMNQGEDILI